MQFESTTLEAVYEQPTVSDIALQLMVAVVASGRTIYDIADCFATAERFVVERDARSKTGPAADLEKLAAMCESGKYEDGWATTTAGKRMEAVLGQGEPIQQNEWHPYPATRPTTNNPVLVLYTDGRFGVESAVTDRGCWFFKNSVPVVQWQEIIN